MPRVKRKSGPRYRHVRFFRLKVGEAFLVGNAFRVKCGHFSAEKGPGGALVRVMPWDKVRSYQPVKELGQTIQRGERIQATYSGKPPFASSMGCQGDSDSHYSLIMATHAAKLTCGHGGDRTPESIGGTEKTPSA